MPEYLPCPNHSGRWFHPSTGGCDCGSSHAGPRLVRRPSRITPPGGLVRTYRGANIYRATANSAGMRYETYAGGRFHRADTMAGIREAIREALGVSA